ncbi:hypothetical protein PoB_005254000 [Plakobranchus ocellatus]|uniref:Uncharacterized protein n=1 Tax=Plakobranchus ocellatus TaxID=259542 RepID=A0AAV4C032_9GAST|nr:hypothetical protein PoB_005254000 [Plakobranchus ocellatus]
MTLTFTLHLVNKVRIPSNFCQPLVLLPMLELTYKFMDPAKSAFLGRTKRFWRRNFVSIVFPTAVITSILLDYRRTQQHKRTKAAQATL